LKKQVSSNAGSLTSLLSVTAIWLNDPRSRRADYVCVVPLLADLRIGRGIADGEKEFDMRFIGMLTLFFMMVTRAEACSVVLYFPMMFEGAENYTRQLTGGVIIAIAAAVVVKALLLDRHLRTTPQYRKRSIASTLPRTLAIVALANVLSTLVGYSFAGSFRSSWGFQIVLMPVLAAISLSVVWSPALALAAVTSVSRVPIKPRWLLGMTLVALLATPTGLLWTVFGHFDTWGGKKLYFTAGIVAFLILLVVFIDAWYDKDSISDAVPATNPRIPVLTESDQRLLSQFLVVLCGAGFITAFAGSMLLDVSGNWTVSLATSGAVLRYWLVKLVITTSMLGLALFSTTAFEAIVLLPFYRFIFEPASRQPREIRLDAYRNFFGDLFRINAVAVGVVLLIFAIRTLPVRLASPGFLY